MIELNHILRLNVGFILNEDVGYYRDIDFEAPQLRFDDDLTINDLRGIARLTRTPLGILVYGQFQAQHHTVCSRCLNPATDSLSCMFSELYSFPADLEAEFSIPDSRMLNLEPLVAQDLRLAEDMHVLCQPDCKGLCLQCGQNLNDGQCNCQTEEIDPRLIALKRLLDQT